MHHYKRSSHGQARKATGGDKKKAAAKIWRRQRSGGAKDAKAGEVARKERRPNGAELRAIGNELYDASVQKGRPLIPAGHGRSRLML